VGRIYRAFWNSVAGFAFALRTERAIKQEFALLIIGVPLALWLGHTVWLKLAMILALVAVLCVEFLNTCLEKLCDHVTPERHDHIKAIKDMGSAACFCAQGSAALIWAVAVIFGGN
jgi:diacylglycerol kinase (ATP)